MFFYWVAFTLPARLSFVPFVSFVVKIFAVYFNRKYWLFADSAGVKSLTTVSPAS